MSRNDIAGRARPLPGLTIIFAMLAGLTATGVSADTLAQPKDDSLERTAAGYIQYREDVAAIEAMPFDNAGVTREAHRRLSAHEPETLSDGWVAYAALVAADTPEFAAALKKEMRKSRRGLKGADRILSELAMDPSFARRLKGANKAIDAVIAMTVNDGARITELGEAFKAQAYAMQKTSWGKKRIASSAKRLSEAADYGRNRARTVAPNLDRRVDGGVLAPALASADAQWSANWGQAEAHGRLSDGNAEVIMDRVLNLAARYSIGATNTKVVDVFAQNNKSERCLEMAKLTLDQCIAATRTPYEEAFCLGEHALIDTASCQGWIAGASAS